MAREKRLHFLLAIGSMIAALTAIDALADNRPWCRERPVEQRGDEAATPGYLGRYNPWCGEMPTERGGQRRREPVQQYPERGPDYLAPGGMPAYGYPYGMGGYPYGMGGYPYGTGGYPYGMGGYPYDMGGYPYDVWGGGVSPYGGLGYPWTGYSPAYGTGWGAPYGGY